MAKYQVSCDLSYDLPADRDEIYTYLHGKKTLAFTEKGDFLTLENVIDGSFRVSCTYRLTKLADRDEIETYLKGKKAKARVDKPGHIEKHTCEHDTGKPCVEQVVDIWGGEL